MELLVVKISEGDFFGVRHSLIEYVMSSETSQFLTRIDEKR
jgi:hypothetical protein